MNQTSVNYCHTCNKPMTPKKSRNWIGAGIFTAVIFWLWDALDFAQFLWWEIPMRDATFILLFIIAVFFTVNWLFIFGGKKRCVLCNSTDLGCKTKEEIETLVSQQTVDIKGDTQEVSMAEELSKLAKLRSDGVLSEEEFQEQKTQLLG